MGDGSGLIAAAIDQFIGAVFATVPVFGVEVELIVLWMALPMLALTLYYRFANLRLFGAAVSILRGRFRDDKAPGEVSQAQALATALSGTVGLGNIAGVAVAIAIGGPGAAFWMFVIGFCAMSLKFTEVTLALKYRIIHPDGTVSGGPVHYLERGLAARGWKRRGKILAISYGALALVPSILQLAQVNQSYSQISHVLGIANPMGAWIYGVAIAALTALVIVGGIKSIARVTGWLVPLMTLLYLGAALVILAGHWTLIPDALATILREALNPQAGWGGVVGAFVVGMRRAVYSTEAGLGSATFAHAAARTREPVSEGLVALLEPFIDTMVISTATALVIVITGAYQLPGLDDIRITSTAFNSVIAHFDLLLTLAVFLFAFSTIISWCYYAGKIWAWMFGGGKRSMTVFRSVYCLALVPGAALTVEQAYGVMDSLFFLMAVPNIIGIYLMAGEVGRDLNDYQRRVLNKGVPHGG